MQEILRNRKKDLIIYGILTMSLAGLIVANSFVLNLLTDIATSYKNINYFLVVVGILMFIFIQSLVYYFQQFLADKYSKLLKTDLKNRYLNEYIDSSLCEFNKKGSSYYLAQLTSNLDLVEENYFKVLFWGGYLVTQFIFALVAACFINPMLALLSVILSIPSILVPIIFKNKIEASSRDVVHAVENNTTLLNDLLQGTQSWKLAISEERIKNQLLKENQALLEKQIQHEKVQNYVGVFNKSFSDLLYFGSWMIGIYFILTSNMTLGKIVAFTQLVTNISFPLNSVIGLVGQFMSGDTAYRELSHLLSKDKCEERDVLLDEPLRSIQYKDMNYFSEEKQILNHVNLSLDTTKRYLIKGRSGAGKSSLFYPLLNLSSEYTGEIKLNDIDIRKIKESSIYQKIGYFTQKDRIFHATIRNNLTMFHDEYDDRALIEVLNKVHLTDWMSTKTLDTIISEDELSLSAGERQRFLLARLLLRSDNFIIFDEVTAGLNPEMAEAIEQLILTLPIGWIMISHIGIERLEKEVDVIFQVSQGRVQQISL